MRGPQADQLQGKNIDDLLGRINSLTEPELVALRRLINSAVTRVRAQLSLVLNAAVQYEIDRLGGTDGPGLIASVAGMSTDEIWALLSSDYRPSEKTWGQIKQVLVLCHSSRATEKIMSAEKLFDELRDLERKSALVFRTIMDLRRRQAPGKMRRDGRGNERATAPTVTEPAGSKARSAQDGKQDGALATSKTETGAPEVVQAERAAGPSVISDLPGVKLRVSGRPVRPDPLVASTKGMFVQMMRAYRIWAGNPSYREMEQRCDKKISYSTFRNILTRNTMPAKLETVEIFVRVLGGNTKDVQRWATAWRRLALEEDLPVRSSDPDREIPALKFVDHADGSKTIELL